jgi:hypothetical protein
MRDEPLNEMNESLCFWMDYAQELIAAQVEGYNMTGLRSS